MRKTTISKMKDDKISIPVLDDALPHADVFTTSQVTPVSTPNDAILQDKTNAPRTSAHVQSLNCDRKKGSISTASNSRILPLEEENRRTDILTALPPLNSTKDQSNKSKRKKIQSLTEKPEVTPPLSKLETRTTRSSSKLKLTATGPASLQDQRSKVFVVIYRLSQEQIDKYEKKNNTSSQEQIVKDPSQTDHTAVNIEQDGDKGICAPTPTTIKNSVDVENKNSYVSSNPLSDTESGYGTSPDVAATRCSNNSLLEEELNKNTFASSLGLQSRNTTPQASYSHAESRTLLNLPALLKVDYVKTKKSQKARGKASQQQIKNGSDQNLLKKFLRVTGAPITSGLGQKLCMEFGKVGEKDLEKYRQKEAKFCQGKEETKFRQKKYLNVCKKVTTNFHLYSFNRVQRLTRNQELVLGLGYKSFPAFNEIKLNPKVRLNRVSQAVIRKSRRWNFMRRDILSTLQATIVINSYQGKMSSSS